MFRFVGTFDGGQDFGFSAGVDKKASSDSRDLSGLSVEGVVGSWPAATSGISAFVDYGLDAAQTDSAWPAKVSPNLFMRLVLPCTRRSLKLHREHPLSWFIPSSSARNSHLQR